MTGDASSRRYERLTHPDGQSVILMDAPPASCGSQSQFVDIASHLTSIGLAAPEVLDWDDANGVMIISDLGHIDFAKHLRGTPQDESSLYHAAVDVLSALQSDPPPAGLTDMTPDVGADMISLAFEWAAADQSTDLSENITSHIRSLLKQVNTTTRVLSLRDFHAENLIWRPDQPINQRIGLLDFQDAFITHPTYDLASLLRDARRDVDPGLLDPLLRQLAGQHHNFSDFKRAFHVMAVQRNLRILGIFHRLAATSGKSNYLALIPRVWDHLLTDISTPDFTPIAPLIKRAFAPKASS
ncbi:MAG: aminoglycoside phosphotransferase family protein [Octadecabacter sp.]